MNGGQREQRLTGKTVNVKGGEWLSALKRQPFADALVNRRLRLPQFTLTAVLFVAVRAHSVDLANLPTNTWVNMTPTYISPSGGGHIFPQVWNNKGAFDSAHQRVIVMD